MDDHPFMRKGLGTLLESEAYLTVVGEASNGEEAIDQVKKLCPDIVVMDITMPKLNGIEATRQIVSNSPEIKIIALSIHTEKRFVQDMLKAGARGYVLKDSAPEELIEAINTVITGEAYLSAPVMGAVVSGLQDSGNETAGLQSIENPDVNHLFVLQTKLHRPPTPLNLVTRPRLLEQLETERVKPFILVSAPAGYGKSVVISNWLEQSDWRSAWISLDEEESDLRQFLVYFVAAVESVFSDSCQKTQMLLTMAQLPPLKAVATSLINELDMLEQPLILVIDDYHRINAESEVNKLLELLLLRPPLSLHLVLITRRDPPMPLFKLRAKAQVSEIRMQDLKFDAEEARILLQAAGITASEDALANMEQVLEGWVAGLRLLSLAVRHIKDPETYLKNLHGGFHQAQEYMIEEVIGGLSPILQKCVLKCAILDRFCSALCHSVCADEGEGDVSGFDGSDFIHTLNESNLFTIPLDNTGKWFRYHHLFQELLKQQLEKRLTAEEISELHKRASGWFEAESLIEEAIQHALAAGDIVGAADVVERNKETVIMADQWYVLDKWMKLLPETVVEQRVELLMARAWVLYFQSKYELVLEVVDLVESLMGVNRDQHAQMHAEVAFFRGSGFYWQGKGVESMKLVQEAIEKIPAAHAVQRTEAEFTFVMATQMVKGEGEATNVANELFNSQPLPHGLRKVRLLSIGVFIHIISGDLVKAAIRNRHFHEASIKLNSVNMETWSNYLQGLIHLYRYELEAAATHLEKTVKNRLYIDSRAAIDAFLGLLFVQQKLSRIDDLHSTQRQLQEFADSLNYPEYYTLVDSAEARLAIQAGKQEKAIHWLKRTTPPDAEVMMMFFEVSCVTWCRALIAEGLTASLAQAEQRLLEYVLQNESIHHTLHLIEVLTLLVMVREKQGRRDEALTTLERALMLAQPGNLILPFLESGQPMVDMLECLATGKEEDGFLSRVLDTFSKTREEPVIATAINPDADAYNLLWDGESLTKRELDILKLLVQRLQNKEIANRLFVSTETVKTHLKHLFQKLDVSNRQDAAAKADQILQSARTSKSNEPK